MKNINLTMDIDFEALREQKMVLLKIANRTQNPDNRDALDGLIHLLDAVQDQVVNSGQRTEAQVFGEKVMIEE